MKTTIIHSFALSYYKTTVFTFQKTYQFRIKLVSLLVPFFQSALIGLIYGVKIR